MQILRAAPPGPPMPLRDHDAAFGAASLYQDAALAHYAGLMNQISEVFRASRRNLGLSQEAVALSAGLAVHTYRSIEGNGPGDPLLRSVILATSTLGLCMTINLSEPGAVIPIVRREIL